MEQKTNFKNSSLDFTLPVCDLSSDELFIVPNDDNIRSFSVLSVARAELRNIFLGGFLFCSWLFAAISWTLSL